ncbi:hypothetical protein [Sporosarcina sp. FA9]|uniref:hypothetical protein n=1 Tax=Sporosarcina sp. FA9 TaxID=3413030 RepID=UPI003F65904D
MRPVNFYSYHGTSLIKAEEIIRTNIWKPIMKRGDHWLGHGSYFFREDFEQAKIWARTRYDTDYKTKKDLPAVVEVKITLEGEKFLNLDSREGIKFLDSHISYLIKEKGLLIEGPEELLKTPVLACFVFSAINKHLKWVILKTFPGNSNRYTDNPQLKALSFKHKENLITFNLSGTQVCVRNNKAIKEMSIKWPVQENATNKISVSAVRRGIIPSELFGK